MKWLAAVALVLATITQASVGSAYTIASGFTKSCHERMSVPALTFLLSSLEQSHTVPLPADDLWNGATEDVRGLIHGTDELAALLEDERLRFAAVSLFVGLREPDTDGHSVTDLSAIRSVHGDPAPKAQYAHALRSSEDVGSSGDLNAIIGTRQFVREQLEHIRALLSAPGAAQIEETFLYVEHYGRIEVEVWGPAYRLGLVLHTLQDSFSHSIRTPDSFYILHVMNYVDAFSGQLDENVDGLAHSTAMDQCDREENEVLVAQARRRGTALIAAALKNDEGQAVDAGLSDCSPEDLGAPECGWFSYEPTCQERVLAEESLEGTCCSRESDFCDAENLDMILATPTQPYLKEAFGCTVRPGSGSSSWALIVLLVGCAMLLRRGRARGNGQYTVRWTVYCPWWVVIVFGLLGLLFAPRRAAAQERYPASPVIRIEGHGSLLTDAERASLLNISYGPGLRGGYRFTGQSWGQLGVYGLVERDLWVVSDFENRVDPGVINLALGVEYLYFDYLRSALSVGPSILVFDTGLHDSGNVGIYTELHPLGVQFNFKHRWALSFDPLSVAWVNPTPENGKAPSVGHLQYRTTIALEWRAVPQTR